MECIAISFSRWSSQPRAIVDRCFTIWATREVQVMGNTHSNLRHFFMLLFIVYPHRWYLDDILLKRKSEMGHCNSPPPREENRVFLDTERKGWLCLPLLPNFYCLLIHWAQRPRPWQPGGLWSITSSLLGLDSDCKRRPTRATPTTWAVQLLSP